MKYEKGGLYFLSTAETLTAMKRRRFLEGSCAAATAGVLHLSGFFNQKAYASDSQLSDLIFKDGFSAAGTCSVANWDLIATHPDAVLQPTSGGKKLSALQAFNGKLYAGYGDSVANTGPIKIRAYDPESSSWTAPYISFQTDCVKRFKHYDGKIYAVDDDPRGSNPGGWASGSVDPADPGSELWVARNHVPIIHSYDLAKLGNKILVAGMGQGRNGRGALFVSPEIGGASSRLWEGGTSTTGPLLSVGVLNGVAYWADPDDRTGGQLYRYNGTSVTKDGPSFTYPAGTNATYEQWAEFNGRLLALSYGKIHSTDGVSAVTAIPDQPSTTGFNPYRFITTANRIYVLYRGRPNLVVLPNGVINVTYPTARVYHKLGFSGAPEFLATDLPEDIESIAILNKYIYAGGSEGRLYRYCAPVPV